MQFEQVSLEYLLIPSYSYNVKTLYDIDYVQRILQNCLYFDQQVLESVQQGIKKGDFIASTFLTPLTNIGKLVDDFLANAAPYVNLMPD